MRYFFDTEFIEDGKIIDLISIGIVCEDGRELYLGNRKCDFSKASQWVRDNVLVPMGFHYPSPDVPMRPIDPRFWFTKGEIANFVFEFCDPSFRGKPEFWGYYADYDWVVFCQLFGTMMDLPRGFPMYCRDIKQECDRLGNPRLPEQGKGEHNALEDARWNKKAYEFLSEIKSIIMV